MHSQYRPRANNANDIALVRLASAAYLNKGVSTVCLPLSPDDIFNIGNLYVTVVGWGLTDPNNIASFTVIKNHDYIILVYVFN